MKIWVIEYLYLPQWKTTHKQQKKAAKKLQYYTSKLNNSNSYRAKTNQTYNYGKLKWNTHQRRRNTINKGLHLSLRSNNHKTKDQHAENDSASAYQKNIYKNKLNSAWIFKLNCMNQKYQK